MAANFLEKHEDLAINGIPLLVAIQSECETMKEYISNVILKDREDARLIVIPIMPIVLRISIDCVFFDLHDKINMGVPVEQFAAKTTDVDLQYSDSLNLHDQTISVLLKPGHYDIIYDKHSLDAFHINPSYDKSMADEHEYLEKEQVYDLDKDQCKICVICLMEITNPIKGINHCAGGSYHKKCVINHQIVMATPGRSLLYCPYCNKGIEVDYSDPSMSSIFLPSSISKVMPSYDTPQAPSIIYKKSVVMKADPSAMSKSIAFSHMSWHVQICCFCKEPILDLQKTLAHKENEQFHESCFKRWLEIKQEDPQFMFSFSCSCPFCGEPLPDSVMESIKDMKSTAMTSVAAVMSYPILRCCKKQMHPNSLKCSLLAIKYDNIFSKSKTY